jgi:hypothetical protein
MEEPLDAIAEADTALSRIIEVQAQIDALMAVRAEALVAFDDAFTAAYPPDAAALRERARNAEAACGLRMPEGTVQRLFGEARFLTRELPATLGGLAAGHYSYAHAQVLIDETAGLEADDRAAVERVALGTAATTTAAQFRRRVRKLREKRRPETMPQRAEEARTRRSVTMDPLTDGMACLMLYTGAVEIAAIYERVCEAAAREKADGDPRTITQLRADLMVDALLERHSALGLSRTQLRARSLTAEEAAHLQETELGSFSGIVPTVMVTVPVMTRRGGPVPGMRVGVGPIDAPPARRRTAEAPTLYRVLTDPETGISLSMSRTSYRVSDPLRRWLRLRDETCTFAMCGISARRCDIDHTRDWHAHDGPTDHDNLAHLSRGHHTLKHHGGWRVRQDRPGHLTWTSYLGREYTVGPASA